MGSDCNLVSDQYIINHYFLIFLLEEAIKKMKNLDVEIIILYLHFQICCLNCGEQETTSRRFCGKKTGGYVGLRINEFKI